MIGARLDHRLTPGISDSYCDLVEDFVQFFLDNYSDRIEWHRAVLTENTDDLFYNYIYTPTPDQQAVILGYALATNAATEDSTILEAQEAAWEDIYSDAHDVLIQRAQAM